MPSTAGLLVLLAAAVLSWLTKGAPGPTAQTQKPTPTYEAPGPEAADKPQRSSVTRHKPVDGAQPLQRVIEHVRVSDQRTGHVYEGRVDLSGTLDRIARGEHFPHRNDGSVFQNRPLPGRQEPELPRKPNGYYHEYVHPTPDIDGPGPQRIIVGQGGEYYYTPDHYQTFIALQ
jgi:guanyl-specific ribonuclease Sa